MASLNEYTEKLGKTGAAHLLRRSTFGPDINQIQQFGNLTSAEAMEILFAESDEEPVPPIDPKTVQS